MLGCQGLGQLVLGSGQCRQPNKNTSTPTQHKDLKIYHTTTKNLSAQHEALTHTEETETEGLVKEEA